MAQIQKFVGKKKEARRYNSKVKPMTMENVSPILKQVVALAKKDKIFLNWKEKKCQGLGML